MAAIDFPNAPALNQLFTASNGITYQWDGTTWVVYGTSGVISGATAAPTYDTYNTKLLLSGEWTVGDNVMQITHGKELFNRSFTALDATHPIEVDVDVPFGAGGAAVWCIAGIFIDGAANAVSQVAVVTNTQWGAFARVRWQGVIAAGPHTFSVRCGGANGQGCYINGNDSYRVGGGVQRCAMTIREIGTGVQGPPGQPGPAGGWQTGDTVLSYRTVPSVGWIIMDDGTVGDASSGATTRANADCIDLFTLLWGYAGCTIAGGKGASTAADWGAHKALGLPKVLSRLIGIGGAAGAGLNAHNPADTVGTSETPTTGGDNYSTGINPQAGGWAFANQGHGHSQVMPPTAYQKMHIKL
jgi:hypothetical protein